jgi:hypothetical protein
MPLGGFYRRLFMKKTISEILFENICNKQGLSYSPIVREGTRTPDYLLTIRNTDIIVEVKQLDPNKKDKERYETIKKGRRAIAFFTDDKTRVREKIKIASKQLRRYAKGKKPSILILYDNTHGFSGLDGYGILTAMYGDESIPIFVDENHELEPFAGPAKFGGGRRFTRNEKNYISAIGMIKFIFTDEPEILLFHNIYAERPIDPFDAVFLASKQFTISKGDPNVFREWTEIKMDQPPNKRVEPTWPSA